MTRKLELISLRLDVQFQTLLSDVIALTTGVLRLTLVTFQEMLQFKAILEGQVIDKQFQLPSVSQIFKTASLYTRPVLFGNVLILTLRVPLLCRSKSFSLFKSKTFPLSLHRHFSQLVGLPTYLIVSNTYIGFPNADDARRCEYMSKHDTCQLDVATQPLQPADCPTALILNSVSGVKAYCHFKLLIQSVPSPPHIDYLLHGHYLLTNMPSLSVICKNSSISDVRVIQGCSSCFYNFPCYCTIRTSNLTLYTGFHGRAYKRSSKVHLVGFTVNLGFFQHVNMSLAKLIDPSRLFAESFGLTKTEHFGRLLGVGTNFISRQAEIFKHAQENSIELGTYVKQLTMSQKEFDEQRELLHQSTKNIILGVTSKKVGNSCSRSQKAAGKVAAICSRFQ